ncbi:MAG: ABC transporter substrate-binding protein [Chloroflexi bacterium]|nr:ABC transporter substrate-binding protein [Chloroflexota bacterium]
MKTARLSVSLCCTTLLSLFVASCTAAVPAPVPKPTPATSAGSAVTPAARPAAPTPTVKQGAEQARYGGVLTVGVGGDPPSLDPHREETHFNYSITSAAYNGLTKYDPAAWPEAKVVPDLATSWDLSPDGRVHTFRLAKEAKFHDGTPLTAEDVKFSLDRIRDPNLGLAKSPRRQQLSNITSIDAPDANTVKITLGHPQASFVPSISAFYYSVMPKRVVLENKNDMSKTVVGTGAFKFKDYASGVGWDLVKNTSYFVAGRPYLDGVKGYIILDSFARFAALRTRNILWWSPNPVMTASQAKTIEDSLSDKIAVKWGFHPAYYGMAFNVTKAPWNDVRLRQAVSLSFDRKKMLAAGLDGAGIVGMAAQPPGEWSLPEADMVKVPGYAGPDIEGARRLLAQAGFANGLKTEILVRAVPLHQAMAVVFKDAVASIGINVDLNVQETAVYSDQRFRKAFSTLALTYGAAGTDPDNILGPFYVTGAANNFSGYSNPRYDELFTRQSQALDPAERRELVWEMQRILLAEVPIAISYWGTIPYAWWRDVRGYNPPSLSNYHAYMYADIWLAR